MAISFACAMEWRFDRSRSRKQFARYVRLAVHNDGCALAESEMIACDPSRHVKDLGTQQSRTLAKKKAPKGMGLR